MLWPATAHRDPKARSTSRPKARRVAPRARRALASETPGRHQVRVRGGRAGRPLRERRVHLRQEAARRDRSPRALPAQAADGHSRRRSAARRQEQGVLRRVVRATRRDGGTKEYRLVGPDESGFAPDNISMDSPLGRAVHRQEQSIPRSWCRTPDGEARYELAARALRPRDRTPKKSPARGRASHRGKSQEGKEFSAPAQLRAQLIAASPN